MKNIKKFVKEKLQSLQNSLNSEKDSIIKTNHPSGAVTRQSKIVGDARSDFIKSIRELLISNEITIEDANYATREFGLKTKKLFWK